MLQGLKVAQNSFQDEVLEPALSHLKVIVTMLKFYSHNSKGTSLLHVLCFMQVFRCNACRCSVLPTLPTQRLFGIVA